MLSVVRLVHRDYDDYEFAHMKTICAHTHTHALSCKYAHHFTLYNISISHISPILISTVSNWTSARERSGTYCSRLHSDLSDRMQILELLTDAARQAERYASGTASWLFVFLACGSQQMVEHLQLGPESRMLPIKAPFDRTKLVLQTMRSWNYINYIIISIWSGNAGWKRPASAMQFAALGTSWMLRPVFSAACLGVMAGVTRLELELLQGKGWQRQLQKRTEVAEILDCLIFHFSIILYSGMVSDLGISEHYL